MDDKMKPEHTPLTVGAFMAMMNPMWKRQADAFATLQSRIEALEAEVAKLKGGKKK